MTAASVLANLALHGFVAVLDERGQLALEGEEGAALTPELRAALKVHKAAMVKLLQKTAAPTTPPAAWAQVRLADLHEVLEIVVPGVDLPVLLAPGCRLARELRAQQQGRAVVLCTCVVLDMLIAGVSANDAQAALQVAAQFDGEVVGVLPHAGRTTGGRPC